jgi:hypothetical protein
MHFTRLNPAFGGFAKRNSTGQVSFIGIYLFNRLFRMSAVNRTIRQIIGIVHRSRRHGGSQDKAIVDIDRSLPR